MIFIRLHKLKIVLPQLINKSPVNLAIVNILILLAIDRAFYIVWSLHKANISYSIAYRTTIAIYSLVTDIFVKVHIVV